MKKVIRFALLISLLGLTFSCEEEEALFPREYPRIKTLPVTEITPNGAVFNAVFQLRGDFEILSYGFVWLPGLTISPSLSNAERVVIAENIQEDTFSAFIGSKLQQNQNYKVRAFVQTNDFVVYGEEVTFESLGSNGPELLGFSPRQGHLTDTLRITGTDFGSFRAGVEVRIDQLDAPVIEFSSNELSVLVPDELSKEQAVVRVSLSGNASTFEEKFTLLKPIIETIDAPEATFGSDVVITGSNYNPVPNQVAVSFVDSGGTLYPVEVNSISETRIQTSIPPNVASKELQVILYQNNFEVIGDQIITLEDPEVASFLPASGKTLSEITIQGANFSSITENNLVRIDGYKAEIIESGNNELVVVIPDQANHIYSSREVSVTVEVFSTEVQATDTYRITDKWFRLADLPFTENPWKGLSIGQTGYVLFEGGLWRFDQATGSWNELAAFPQGNRFSPGIFAIGDNIYLGAGYNPFTNENSRDFWEYDVGSDLWTRKADFPGEGRSSPLAFALGSNGYLGAGYRYQSSSCCSGFSDVWKYDAFSDSWSQVPDHPAAGPRGLWRLVTANLNGEVYVGMGTAAIQGTTNDEFYKYNTVSDQWIRIADYPLSANFGHSRAVAFTLGNQVYFGSAAYPDSLGVFDGSAWSIQEAHPAGRNGGFSFVIDNIAYFGAGEYSRQQFWTFDVSQPD